MGRIQPFYMVMGVFKSQNHHRIWVAQLLNTGLIRAVFMLFQIFGAGVNMGQRGINLLSKRIVKEPTMILLLLPSI